MIRITVIDTDDVATAREILGLRVNGTHQPAPAQRVEAVKAIERAAAQPSEPLHPVAYATWEWLTHHPDATTKDIAKHFDVSHQAAATRINTLIGKGLAYRVKRGVYRAGER